MEMKEFVEKINEYAESIGSGAHKITPRVDVECESEEIDFYITEIQIDQSVCGCPIGLTIKVERDES